MAIPLLLLAAGGLARETAEAAARSQVYDVVGYLDDDPSRWGTNLDGVEVVGGLDTVDARPDAALLICAGRGASRTAIARRLALLGVSDQRYATVIDPSVSVPRSCSVGVGSILLAGCVLTTSVQIGKHVVCMPNVTLTHDDVLADFATICAGVSLGGSVRIGERAYLGMNSSVRENLAIADDAVVGMGSAVIQDVPEGQTWVGVPARPRVNYDNKQKAV
jgi:sugar O-acyltransferase (sialic acid O-acetyltransferase NeuD family)